MHDRAIAAPRRCRIPSLANKLPWFTLSLVLTGAVACADTGVPDEVGGAEDEAPEEPLGPSLEALDADRGPGDTGDGVRAVQAYLARFGYLPNDALAKRVPTWRPLVAERPEPGLFNEVTARAVEALQASVGIARTGIVDAATRHVLRSPRYGVPEGMPWQLLPGSARDIGVGAGERAEDVSVESQCGPVSDLQDVEQYDGTAGVSQAFVIKHERRVGYHVNVGCSGTLISDDLFLSAGHCGYLVNHVVRFDYQDDASGTPRATRDFRVTEVVEQEDNGFFDYAIVRLADDPGREYGHAAIAAIDPPTDSTVAIIQHPAKLPKAIHAGPVLDYSSGEGTNWFRHQVDTEGGSSGSGVLNTDGQLVGVHTNAGCVTSTPVRGNSAMRMSQLVPHSPTLQALVRSRILWQHTSGRIKIWSLNPGGQLRTSVEHGPFPGWTPVGMADNRVLWQHSSGLVSIWRIDQDGNLLSAVDHQPSPGWTPVNYANHRVLMRHTGGAIALWTVDDAGNFQTFVQHGPSDGWTAVNYANNRILWRHTSGAVVIWTVDDAGNFQGSFQHGPFDGWTALQIDNSELLWRYIDGRTSHWQLDRVGNMTAWLHNGPFAGFTARASVDRRMLWWHTSGAVVYWTVNGDGAPLSEVDFAPIPGWTALFTAGGEP